MCSWSFVSGYPLWGHLGYHYFWTMPTWKPLFFCIWHVDSLGHAGLPSFMWGVSQHNRLIARGIFANHARNCWWVWPLSQRSPFFFQGLWRMPCCSTGRSLIFRAGRDEGWSFAQPGVQNQNCGWRFCRKNHPLGDLQYFLQILFLMLGMDMPLYCKHLNVHTSKKHSQPPYPPQAHDQMPPSQCFTLLEKACDSIHFKYCNLPRSLEPPDRNIWDNNHLARNLEVHFGLGFFEAWADLGGYFSLPSL